MERNTHDTSVHFRMATIQPLSSRRRRSAAIAKAKGMVTLMYPR